MSGLEPRLQDCQQQFHGLANTSFAQDQLSAVNTELDGSSISLLDLSQRLRKVEQQLSELSRGRQSSAVGGDLTIPTTVPRLRNTADKTKLFGPTHWVHTAEKVVVLKS
jgi:hypothetical protein